jgi:hypothetical protein
MPNRRHLILTALSVLTAPSISSAGAWSHESFENDGALDWADEFEEKPTVDFVRRTLARGATGKFIESFDGECVIAAAEVVAASLGRAGKGFPLTLEPVVAKLRAQIRALAPQAQTALDGVLGSQSELRQSWSLHAEDLHDWESSVKELRQRLSPRAA